MAYQTTIDVRTLAAQLDNPGWLIFDCRFNLMAPEQGKQEYEAGHIPGSIYAHLDKNLASPKLETTGRHPLPDTDTFVQWLRNSGLNQNSQVIVYDAVGGMFAARLWWMLRWLGHQSVAVLDGGWPAWVDSGREVTTDIGSPVQGNFQGQPRRSMWVTSREVEAVSAGVEPGVIIDARAQPRFDGEREPIDPVAGHVPGAVNYPCSLNVDERGFFKTPKQIRSQLEQQLDIHGTVPLINMCGSGVTACRNILAMEIAGVTDSKLYVGSWSEWITDPDRPRD